MSQTVSPRWTRWVSQFSKPAEREAALCIFAWEGLFVTMNDLVFLFNSLEAENSGNEANLPRDLHPKRMLISLFYELEQCLNRMKRVCYRNTEVSEEEGERFTAFNRQYRARIRLLEEERIERIRHFTFHPKSLFLQSEDLIARYDEIESTDVTELQSALDAAFEYGFALRDQLYKIAPPFKTL